MLKTFFFFYALMIYSQGRCFESDLEQHVYPKNVLFTVHLEQCGAKSWGRSEHTRQCLLAVYPTLSEPCASCFGEYTSCVKSNCWWTCIRDHGAPCQTCAIKHCQKDLAACTGVHESRLPSRY